MMLRRSGFSRPTYNPPRQPVRAIPALFRAPGRIEPEVKAVPKTEHVECERYRRLVAVLPCIACGMPGMSQCAHPNTGKAAGRKLVEDRLCFPLCADSPGRRGCHSKFDQGALFSKAVRREIEPAWGADTRRRITAMGKWPEDLDVMNVRAKPPEGAD